MSEPDIVVVGLSHHTAPVHVRERLSVATDAMPSEVARLVGALPLDEAVVISTCNRVEIYAATTRPAEALTQARAYLVERGKPDTIDTFLYAHHGERAVAHAFRVAASLDSMVLGEPQILGQVKDAVAVAATAGTLGPLLGQCFRNAFSVAKRVRRETEIAAGTVSISSIAIELASKIFGTLEARKVLLVGAGKMGEAAAKALSKRGAELAVVNRSPERAQSVAQAAGGRARPFEALAEELAHADVVITSTGSPTFIVGVDSIRGVMRIRKGRPLFIIDIAVPRDVDPRVGEIDNVFVYDVDDLRKVADDNLAHRRKEASSAERIVHEEVQTFETWRASLAVTPTIVALRSQFQRVAELELERAMTRLGHLGPDDRKQVEAAVGRVVQKLLHGPLTELKRGDGPGDTAFLVAAVRRLFELDAQPSLPAKAPTSAADADARSASETPPLAAAPRRAKDG